MVPNAKAVRPIGRLSDHHSLVRHKHFQAALGTLWSNEPPPPSSNCPLLTLFWFQAPWSKAPLRCQAQGLSHQHIGMGRKQTNKHNRRFSDHTSVHNYEDGEDYDGPWNQVKPTTLTDNNCPLRAEAMRIRTMFRSLTFHECRRTYSKCHCPRTPSVSSRSTATNKRPSCRAPSPTHRAADSWSEFLDWHGPLGGNEEMTWTLRPGDALGKQVS